MRISTATRCQLFRAMKAVRDARNYVLAVLSVGSSSGFLRSGKGRVEDIVANMNDITSDVVVV